MSSAPLRDAGDGVRSLLERCIEALERDGVAVGADACAYSVPGRLEVLGKHTDYAGGSSLLAASEQSMVMLAVPRSDNELRIRPMVLSSGARHAVRAYECERRTGATGVAHSTPEHEAARELRIRLTDSLPTATGWGNYPVTTVRRLASNFPEARTGADIAFLSDIPIAAGMSSSSALVVALFLTMAAINGLEDTDGWRENLRTPEELAGYLAAVENGLTFGTLRGEAGVGTMGGSEDHTAMLCARVGELVRYRFAPVRHQGSVPMPSGHRFVVASSGVSAEKAGAARERYNRAAALMKVAAEVWREHAGRDERTIGAVLDADPSAGGMVLQAMRASTHAGFEAAELEARVRQFIAEDGEIIPRAADALQRGDLERFGSLVDRSHRLAEELLGNQIPETSFLARAARNEGAVAASAFGAGFGGSVWALVPDEAAGSFQQRWASAYLSRFPERAADARFMQTSAGPAAKRLL
jgi:galactokinase